MLLQGLRECCQHGKPLTEDIIASTDERLANVRSSTEYREVWQALFCCLPEASAPVYSGKADAAAVCKVMSDLFGLSLSQSGTEVKVRGKPDADVGVLILGFGGASMALLQPVDDAYKKLRPDWRTVATTVTGLKTEASAKAVVAQLLEASEALSGCRHVIVHSLSNNGYGAWIKLARMVPTLGEKLAGCVFDCGMIAGNDMGGQWFDVISKTTLGVLVLANLLPPGMGLPEASKRLNAASRLLADRMNATPADKATDTTKPEEAFTDMSFDAMLEWQLANEKPVPTLCLTSPMDQVVPEAGVRAFAKMLQTAQPSRQVTVTTINAAHCQLGSTDPKKYTEAIGTLLSQTTEVMIRDIGDPEPTQTPSTAEALGKNDEASMLALLGSLGLNSLEETASKLSLSDALALAEKGRPALLEGLKAAGVAKLPDRQKLANAISKELRASRGEGSKTLAAAAAD